MNSLNENWLVFTLIDVIFGVLGYLMSSQTTHELRKIHGVTIKFIWKFTKST